MELAIVVAMAENRVIGAENTLPWHLPEDLKRFKTITMGHPMIMGRLTFESIGRPLPGRITIVVTRNPDWKAPEGVFVATSLDSAIGIAEQEADNLGVNTVMVVGGAKIYEQVLEKCHRLYVTEVHTFVTGDAFFPPVSSTDWKEFTRQRFVSKAADSLSYSFVEYYKSTND